MFGGGDNVAIQSLNFDPRPQPSTVQHRSKKFQETREHRHNHYQKNINMNLLNVWCRRELQQPSTRRSVQLRMLSVRLDLLEYFERSLMLFRF